MVMPYHLRDGPFDIQGRDFFEKKVCFHTEVFNEVKNKKFVPYSANFFEALFPGSYKGLRITQKLTCIKHVDLLLASRV